MPPETKTLPVGANTSPSSLASAIATLITKGVALKLRCIGAGSVTNAGRACAVARGFLTEKHLGLLERPALIDEPVNGKPMTLMVITLDTYTH